MINSIINKDGSELKSKGNKQPVCVFTVASKTHLQYAIPMLKSLRKFHDWPVILFTDEMDMTKIPEIKNLTVVDVTPYLQDKMFFFRQKPIISELLLDEYELVIGMDADQLVLGNLDAILDAEDYDVGTVINWNRYDEKFYPLVQGWGIYPAEYFNCGLVAIRSKKFAHHWTVLCHTPQFDRLQYKEQDILNALCDFGNYNVRCFDHAVPNKKINSWYGMISKGEWCRAIVKDGEIIVPQGFGLTPFPPSDMILRVVHMGGGSEAKKDNWAAFFSPEVMQRINEIICETKKEDSLKELDLGTQVQKEHKKILTQKD